MSTTESKKFFIVLVSMLALIPLLYLVPGVYDTYPNRYGVIFGIVPMALFMAFATVFRPWEFMFLVTGLLLVISGVMFFATGESLISMARAAFEANRLKDAELKFMTDGMSLWLNSLPVIGIGIGINIISTYLSAECPTDTSARQ